MKDAVHRGLPFFSHSCLRATGVWYAIDIPVRILLLHSVFSRRSLRVQSLLLWSDDKLCVIFIFWLVYDVVGQFCFPQRQPVRTKLFFAAPVVLNGRWRNCIGRKRTPGFQSSFSLGSMAGLRTMSTDNFLTEWFNNRSVWKNGLRNDARISRRPLICSLCCM